MEEMKKKMKKNKATTLPPPLFFLFILCFFSTPSSSQTTCSSYKFSNNKLYASCVDLPVLSSFLHWTYNRTTGSAEIAFRRTATSSSQWISWAINPTGRSMTGCQALVAYLDSATGSIHAYTSPITSYSTSMPVGSLSFGVPSLSGLFQNGEMTIFAKLQLEPGTTSVNQVWQEGPVRNGKPAAHLTSGANVQSMRTLNLATGSAPGNNSGGDGVGSDGASFAAVSSPFSSLYRRRNVHGVLNVVSWGILMPIGAMIARYLKVFKAADPAWFYLHATCQTSAYIVGVVGWITGLRLHDPSSETEVHAFIAAWLFAGGTLQVLALLLRPNKDNKYRLYWNIYHRIIGYGVLIVGLFNVFTGFIYLAPPKEWKRAYVIILIVLGSLTIFLEALTWFVVIKRRFKKSPADNPPKNPSDNIGPSNTGA